MVVVIAVAVVAGVWDGLSHSLFLLRLILIVQVVISQAYCVPPAKTWRGSVGPRRESETPASSYPRAQAPSPSSLGPGSPGPLVASLLGPPLGPSLFLPRAWPASVHPLTGIHSRFFTVGCCEDPVVVYEDAPAHQPDALKQG